jgi:hypothetical protein
LAALIFSTPGTLHAARIPARSAYGEISHLYPGKGQQ